MKKRISLVISFILVVCMLVSSGCSKLKASEDDGSVSASAQQQAAEKVNAPVDVDLSKKKKDKEEEKKAKEEEKKAKEEEKKAKAEAKKKAKAEAEAKKKAEAEEKKKAKEEAKKAKEEAKKAKEEAKKAAKEEELKAEEPAKVEAASNETTQEQPEVVGNEGEDQPEESADEPAEAPAEVTDADALEEVAFTGNVEVRMIAPEDLTYGDKITLKAVVSGTNLPYSIRWEASEDGKEWKTVGTGESYSFDLTEGNEAYSYRAVLVSKD